MTEELGYWYALAFGIGHEIDGLVHGQPLPEIRMDLHNNSVGRDSAGGPINQGNLQTSPGSGFGLPIPQEPVLHIHTKMEIYTHEQLEANILRHRFHSSGFFVDDIDSN